MEGFFIVELIFENAKILFRVFFWIIVVAFVMKILCSFIGIIVTPKMKKGLSEFKDSSIFDFFLKIILPMGVITIIISVQQKFSLIELGKEENRLSLVIALLTLYGILYAFIQFTISYAQQNSQDQYWGRSIAKGPFIKSLNLQIFKSGFFSLLLGYVSIFVLLQGSFASFGFLDFLPDKFLESFWEASFLIVFSLCVYVFIKGLQGLQMMLMMPLEKRPKLYKDIETQVTAQYIKLFKDCLQAGDQNYFVEVLFQDVEKIEAKEKHAMLTHVMEEILDSDIFYKKPAKKILWFEDNGYANEMRKRASFVLRLEGAFFEKIEKCSFSIEFKDLVGLYTKSHKIIDNLLELQLQSYKNLDHFTELMETYQDHRRNIFFKNFTYFIIPLTIINQIKGIEEVEYLHEQMKKTTGYKIFLKLCRIEKLELNEQEIEFLKAYKEYWHSILLACQPYVYELESQRYDFLFSRWDNGRYSRNAEEDKENEEYEFLKEETYWFVTDLAPSSENKKYITFLMNKLGYAYKVSMIFYHMLDTEFHQGWKKEVLYFYQMFQSCMNSKPIKNDEKTILFVHEKIQNERSNIGHKIDLNLVRWIFDHIAIEKLKPIILKDLEDCLRKNYISYSLLLKFNFIFLQSRSYLFDFYKEVEHYTFEQSNHVEDWRISTLCELIETPELLKEGFFKQHIYQLCKRDSFNFSLIDLNRSFEVFYINPHLNVSAENFEDIIHSVAGDGIIEFLILNLHKENYFYLMHGQNRLNFRKKIERIIDYKGLSVKEYVQELTNRAREISDFRVMSPRIAFIIEKKLETILYSHV
ncbi:hypothetical protein [Saccharibacillus sacchari]|uniref:hypothetical protein n=1 Tax=Saccharibacillus sacchari TaxID=456493 RepID=UPI0004B5A151|nr:hypothetical protein [Saccharibacillus sacchari]